MRPICPDPSATCYPRLIHFDRILFSRSQNNLCRGKTMDLFEPQQISVPSPCPFTLVYFYPCLRLRVLPFTANSISTRDDFSPEGTNLAPPARCRLEFPQCTVDPAPVASRKWKNETLFVPTERDRQTERKRESEIRHHDSNLDIKFHIWSIIQCAKLILNILQT